MTKDEILKKDFSNTKAVFIDIDGTLLNSKRVLSENTKKAIKRVVDKGVLVVLSSGRPNSHVIGYSVEARASCYAISNNGALLYDYKNNIKLYENRMDYQDLKKIWKLSDSKEVGIIANSTEFRYVNEYVSQTDNPKKKLIEDIEMLRDMDVFQSVITSDEIEKMAKIEEEIIKIKTLKITNFAKNFTDRSIADSRDYFFHVNNQNVNKGMAIQKFANILDVKIEDTICFGDHVNDVEMFEVCGFSVAMGNANESLKQNADYITLTNDDDGVAYFLNNFI